MHKDPMDYLLDRVSKPKLSESSAQKIKQNLLQQMADEPPMKKQRRLWKNPILNLSGVAVLLMLGFFVYEAISKPTEITKEPNPKEDVTHNPSADDKKEETIFTFEEEKYHFEDYQKYYGSYVGDAGSVSKLAVILPVKKYYDHVELQTKSEPYGLTVYYNLPETENTQLSSSFQQALLYNAAVYFMTIRNVDQVTFALKDANQSYTFTRKSMEELFGRPMQEYQNQRELWDVEVLGKVILKEDVVKSFYEKNKVKKETKVATTKEKTEITKTPPQTPPKTTVPDVPKEGLRDLAFGLTERLYELLHIVGAEYQYSNMTNPGKWEEVKDRFKPLLSNKLRESKMVKDAFSKLYCECDAGSPILYFTYSGIRTYHTKNDDGSITLTDIKEPTYYPEPTNIIETMVIVFEDNTWKIDSWDYNTFKGKLNLSKQEILSYYNKETYVDYVVTKVVGETVRKATGEQLYIVEGHPYGEENKLMTFYVGRNQGEIFNTLD